MRTVARRVRYCLSEARPLVQLIFLLRFTAGELLGGQGSEPVPRVLLGAAGWSAATVSVYLFNGIADRVEDVANGSSRPIARGDLPVSFALTVTVLAASLGLAAAWVQGAWPTAAMVAFLVVGYTYSGPPFPLKLTFYTTFVGGTALGFLTYLGGALASGRRPGAGLLVFALAMSFWMGGVGGIAKDLSDVAGDRLAGRRSWPVVFGERQARRLLAAAACVVAASFAVAAAAFSPRLLGSAAAVLIGAVAVVLVSKEVPTASCRARRRLPYRAFMWTQYLSHAVLIGTVATFAHP
jgi:4-hydroxybenzoate polyprenyltransferase